MPLVEAVEISKSFQSALTGEKDLLVISKLSVQIAEGELITIFGPNGCGKSTLMNILAGILRPDSGEITYNSGSPGTMQVGYVFQNHADTLLPWRSVRSNIAFPLELRGVSKSAQTLKVNRRMEQFHLMEHADKYVYELSGGLKQLVAIARATVYDPQLLLLDEPFSSLDYSLSRMLWLRFRDFWANQRVATVFVSHNVDEAVFLGDRVYVLSARPAQVVADVPVPFGRDRPLDLLTSHEFFSIRAEVLDAFERGRQL
jgi:NitT/TauT family transport system ATP-binding protein